MIVAEIGKDVSCLTAEAVKRVFLPTAYNVLDVLDIDKPDYLKHLGLASIATGMEFAGAYYLATRVDHRLGAVYYACGKVIGIATKIDARR